MEKVVWGQLGCETAEGKTAEGGNTSESLSAQLRPDTALLKHNSLHHGLLLPFRDLHRTKGNMFPQQDPS